MNRSIRDRLKEGWRERNRERNRERERGEKDGAEGETWKKDMTWHVRYYIVVWVCMYHGWCNNNFFSYSLFFRLCRATFSRGLSLFLLDHRNSSRRKKTHHTAPPIPTLPTQWTSMASHLRLKWNEVNTQFHHTSLDLPSLATCPLSRPS